MTKSITKPTKVACSLALVYWSLWAIVFVLRILRYCNFISFNVYCGIDIAPIIWFSDSNDQTAQWVILIGYIVTSLIILPLSFRFIYTTLKGVKSDEIFTQSNAKVLTWLSVIIFFHTIFSDNLGILYGSDGFYVSPAPFTCAIITLIVAMLYRLAVKASEENRLTI